MIDTSAIAQGDALRAELDLAAKTAAYEAQFGPVQTMPIEARREQKRQGYNGATAAQPKPPKHCEPKRAGGGSYDWHKAKRRNSIEQVLPLLREGLMIKVIAERTGLSVRTVSRIANSHELAA